MEITFQPKNTDLKFEVSVLTYFFLLFIIYQLPSIFKPCLNTDNSWLFTSILEAIFLPALFFAIHLIFYLVFKRHIIVRGFLTAASGVFMAVGRFIQSPGIIDPVYFFLLSASCAMIIAVYKGDCFDEQFARVTESHGSSLEIIDYIRDNYKFLLGRTFQGWLALGASLGVSMSILFKDGYEELHQKLMALKMLIGFIGISIAIAYWIAIPLVNGIYSIQEKVPSLKND